MAAGTTGQILIKQEELNSVYTKLNTSQGSLKSVDLDLPERSSMSTAMDLYEEKFCESKVLLNDYHLLFSQDVENMRTAYQILIEQEHSLSSAFQGAISPAGPYKPALWSPGGGSSRSDGGRSGSGSGGGSW